MSACGVVLTQIIEHGVRLVDAEGNSAAENRGPHFRQLSVITHKPIKAGWIDLVKSLYLDYLKSQQSGCVSLALFKPRRGEFNSHRSQIIFVLSNVLKCKRVRTALTQYCISFS